MLLLPIPHFIQDKLMEFNEFNKILKRENSNDN